ncbi:homeobox protein engrailed-1-B-like [Liolophura sinensis]|uniref:homeobox protein engrailed-1-B-like n=1 Tax=Liolophura sinensis TaxID=3198878 RepID=UPI0031580762
MKFTNFSIDEILKPSFGSKSSNDSKTAGCSTDVNLKPMCPPSPNAAVTIVKLETLEDQLGGRLSFSGIIDSKGPQLGGRGSEGVNRVLPSPENREQLFPAWIYCTRYSDRPSAGPRSRRQQRRTESSEPRHRTSFSKAQIEILTEAFKVCPYLTEDKRRSLSRELKLHESQIKIWFQNKRAKSKKSSGRKTKLAMNLLEQGLYNHVTRKEES